jgi:hypothetical protein
MAVIFFGKSYKNEKIIYLKPQSEKHVNCIKERRQHARPTIILLHKGGCFGQFIKLEVEIMFLRIMGGKVFRCETHQSEGIPSTLTCIPNDGSTFFH